MIDGKTTTEIIEAVKEQLIPLGEIMKEGGAYGWDLMVTKHFWIDGVMDIVFGILFLILPILYIRFCLKRWDKITRSDFELPITFSFMFAFFSFVFSLFLLASGIANMVMPEYYTIMEIIEMANPAPSN